MKQSPLKAVTFSAGQKISSLLWSPNVESDKSVHMLAAYFLSSILILYLQQHTGLSSGFLPSSSELLQFLLV
jgi:hypothetical protein